jgi:hypothetical protein
VQWRVNAHALEHPDHRVPTKFIGRSSGQAPARGEQPHFAQQPLFRVLKILGDATRIRGTVSKVLVVSFTKELAPTETADESRFAPPERELREGLEGTSRRIVVLLRPSQRVRGDPAEAMKGSEAELELSPGYEVSVDFPALRSNKPFKDSFRPGQRPNVAVSVERVTLVAEVVSQIERPSSAWAFQQFSSGFWVRTVEQLWNYSGLAHYSRLHSGGHESARKACILFWRWASHVHAHARGTSTL